nr:uncharacterized protein LOC104086283 [Nicotiana tomentosiformis]
MNQAVASHTTLIKKIETPLGQISSQLNVRPQGSLPSDTIPNPNSYEVEDDDDEEELPFKYAFPKVKSPKVPKVDLPMVDDTPKVDEVLKKNVPLMVNERPEVIEIPKCAVPIASKEAPRLFKQLPIPPPPFPQRFAKQQQEGQLQKFYDMLNQISINVPFVEALKKMPSYDKFMKDLVTKKNNANFETIKVTHQCSTIISQIGVKKMEDLSAFTIPYAIGVDKLRKGFV